MNRVFAPSFSPNILNSNKKKKKKKHKRKENQYFPNVIKFSPLTPSSEGGLFAGHVHLQLKLYKRYCSLDIALIKSYVNSSFNGYP